MKNISLIAFFVLLVNSLLFGQERVMSNAPAIKRTFDKEQLNSLGLRSELDTISPAILNDNCSTNLFLFPVEGWGFIGGTNAFGDFEKAQRLEYTANVPYLVTEIWGFLDGTVVNNGQIRAKVYSVFTDGGPDIVLGTSETLTADQINTDPVLLVSTIFPFPDPVEVTDTTFFASLDFSDLYATQDTFAVFMTPDGCGSGLDSWELFNDGTWTPINDIVTWELESNFFIFAVVEFNLTSTRDAFIENNGLRIKPAFPNPSSNSITLPFQLQASSEVALEIYSSTGQLLKKTDLGRLQEGPHEHVIKPTAFPSGSYVYSIVTDNGRLSSRFTIQ